MPHPDGSRSLEGQAERRLQNLPLGGSLIAMFSIEHEFDCTIVTLVDEGEAPLSEDLTLHAFAECVTIEQLDPRTDQVQKITLSYTQVRDLAAALDLPEGVYRLVPEAAKDQD